MARSTPSSAQIARACPARRCRGPRRRGLGQLHRRDADAAGGRVDQHALARAQRPVAVQRRPGGGVVDRDRRALLEGQRSGSGNASAAGTTTSGVAAEPRACQDPLADALPHRLRRRRPRWCPPPRSRRRTAASARPGRARRAPGVGEVHPGGAHRDAHLPGPGGGGSGRSCTCRTDRSPCLVMTTARTAANPSRVCGCPYLEDAGWPRRRTGRQTGSCTHAHTEGH